MMRGFATVLGARSAAAQGAGNRLGLEYAGQVGLPRTELPDLILGVVNTALVLAAVVALGYLAYGGFRYITSRGEESEVTAAKGTITYALIGLVAIGIAAALVRFVVDAVTSGG